MSNNDSLVFKIASEPCEFEQIHALNYQTFVDEIPQHQRNEKQKLVDKFHQENIYVICLRDNEVLGMIALRDKRPLSLDGKLENLESYLPGPVSIAEGVMEANSAELSSHRSQQFMDNFNELRNMLCERVNAPGVQVMMGAGTLANDIVAAQLSVLPGRGLVLVNGEFGNRLLDQAIRAALDGISSIGSCDVDLQDVYLATAVSGKGIGSLPGLAMVFCREDVESGNRQLPRYFDLAFYETKQGIPFTLSSNAIYALSAALNNTDWQARFVNVKQWSVELRIELEEIGLTILAEEQCRAPHVTTIILPGSISSLELGQRLEDEGILVSYRSEYLVEKNQIQICFMGKCQKPPRIITYFLRAALAQVLPRRYLHVPDDRQAGKYPSAEGILELTKGTSYTQA